MPPLSETDVRREVGQQTALEPLYHLVLLDDNDHTYQYVVEMLSRVLGYGREKAFALACVVDASGEAIVETAPEHQATRHQAAIHAFGPDPRIERCLGSMTAVLRQAT